MYTCTVCGFKKCQLGDTSILKFRHQRSQQTDASEYIDGISDYCIKCQRLRFFFWFDDKKEPTQQLDAQPTKKSLETQPVHVEKQEHRKVNRNVLDRATKRAVRHEAHKILKQELLAGLPSYLPHGCLWERTLRSQSEDRDRRKRKALNAPNCQRSKSLVNDLTTTKTKKPNLDVETMSIGSEQRNDLREEEQPSSNQNKSRMQQQRDLDQEWQMEVHKRLNQLQQENSANLGSRIPFKDGQLYGPRAAVAKKDQSNYLQDEEELNLSSWAHRNRKKLTAARLRQLDLTDKWQDEVEKKLNQLQNNSKKKQATNDDLKVPLESVRKQHYVGTTADNRLTMDSLINEMKQISHKEHKDHLSNKLLEKEQLVGKWEGMRRRVEDECERVKEELQELKTQQDLEIERKKLADLTRLERQCGGANFVSQRQRGGAHFEPQNQETEEELQKTEKTIGDALDEKLDHMLQTLQEQKAPHVEAAKDVNGKQLFEPTAPPSSDMDLIKTTSGNRKVTFHLSEHIQERETLPNDALEKPKPSCVISKLNFLVSTVQRARLREFPMDPKYLAKDLSPTEHKYNPPRAQFSTVPCSPRELLELLQLKPHVLEPHQPQSVKVSSKPIVCPDYRCLGLFFISDFNQHLIHEHPTLAMERIEPGQPKTFFLSTNVTMLNKAKCHMVYFVKDKCIPNECNKYPDLLPVLVMSSRVRLTDIFASSYDPAPNNDSASKKDSAHNINSTSSLNFETNGADQELLIIWLTSVRPTNIPLIATISVWPTKDKPKMELLNVHTNEVYNIRSSMKLNKIINSSCAMILPGGYVNSISNGGNNHLAVQVQIH